MKPTTAADEMFPDGVGGAYMDDDVSFVCFIFLVFLKNLFLQVIL
jgi:hypothetical protein